MLVELQSCIKEFRDDMPIYSQAASRKERKKILEKGRELTTERGTTEERGVVAENGENKIMEEKRKKGKGNESK